MNHDEPPVRYRPDTTGRYRITRTPDGLVVARGEDIRAAPKSMSIDTVFRSIDPFGLIDDAFPGWSGAAPTHAAMAPIESQEVWAAGVTYHRSRSARNLESSDTSGASFYDRVYDAERPELFFKSTASRVAEPGGDVRIRGDSAWNVPEPELTIAINAAGSVFGYTIGNDMSSRDIEGENPLYLPQAKVYDGSTALGPHLTVTRDDLPPDTRIRLEVRRRDAIVFEGMTSIDQLRRPVESLAAWLYRETSFPDGCYLMTGTGVVPPDDFTLASGDAIRITIEGLGELVNHVA